MGIPDTDSERIAALIHSDTSPVGIDAKQTHVLILYKLEQIEQRLDAIESRLSSEDSGAPCGS
jgi:hypothetical protein